MKTREKKSHKKQKSSNEIPLPIEITGPFPFEILSKVLANSTNSPKSIIRFGAKLSLTNHFHHAFFTQEIDRYKKPLATKLLKYVLHGKAQKAKKLYAEMPELLFIRVTAKDLATGIDEEDKMVHREVTASPFQAALAARDIWMLQDMQDHLHRAPNCQQKINEQIKQQFPNDFCLSGSKYDFDWLAGVILNDEQIGLTGKPSEATQAVIKQFRKDFLPKKCRRGILFNVNHLISAHFTYRKYWGGDDHPNSFHSLAYAEIYWSLVIGYLNRLDTTVNAQASCHGLVELLKNMETLPRDFQLKYFPGMHQFGEISYLSEKLGIQVGIDASFGQATNAIDCFTVTNDRYQTLLDYHNTVHEKFLSLIESLLPKNTSTPSLK